MDGNFSHCNHCGGKHDDDECEKWNATPETDEIWAGEWNHAYLFSRMRKIERERNRALMWTLSDDELCERAVERIASIHSEQWDGVLVREAAKAIRDEITKRQING